MIADLPAETVTIWPVDLGQPVDDLDALLRRLAPDEQDRYGGIRSPRHQRRAIVARAALRTILARLLGAAPDEIRLTTGPHGKPYLAADQAQGLHFNLAHSEDHALVAVARDRPVGVDLEVVQPLRYFDALAARVLMPSERAALKALPEEARLAAFFRAWCCKEAVAKAVGQGLLLPPGHIEVTLDAAPRLVRITGQPDPAGAARHWSLHLIAPGDNAGAVIPPGYVAALAAAGSGWGVDYGEPVTC